MLKEENHNQNIEISLLKEIATESTQRFQGKVNHGDPGPIRKRPARLLPARILYGDRNNSDVQQSAIRSFYGPPTNCSELSKLGYTLNGYYLVKSNNRKIADDLTELETVYCAFKQPLGRFNESKVENRVAAKLKGETDVEKPHKKSDVGEVHLNGKLQGKYDYYLESPERTSTLRPITSSSSLGKYTSCLCNSSKVDHRVQFFAKMKSIKNQIVLHDLDVIKYDELLLNLGKAFNATSGVFTVPKSGVYQFFLHGAFSFVKKGESVSFFITVLRNDQQIDFMIFTETDIFGPRSIQVTSKLVRGDKICLKYFKREKNKHFEGNVSLYRFDFGGSLLEED